MHFSVLLFHESSEDSIMSKYYYDATEEDGAVVEFHLEFDDEDAKSEYEKHIKENPGDQEKYPDIETFMSDYNGYEYDENEEGWGYSSNCLGMYDWHQIGGRWEGILPQNSDTKTIKEIVQKALDLSNPKAQERFKDKAAEYVKLSAMPPKKAAEYLNLLNANSIEISDEISPESIIKKWKTIMKKEGWGFLKKDITKQMITNFIIENEDGTETVFYGDSDEINDLLFIQTYNNFVNLNKQGRSFNLTILDLHT